MTADLVALRARIAAITARGPGSQRESPGVPHRRGDDGILPSLLPRNCVEEATPYGPVIARRERFAEEGEGEVAALASCLGFAADDLRHPVFLDTETTGLSGGTGTVAFMVGLAWRDDGGLSLVQFFLSDFNQEDALLWAVGQYLNDAGVLVSYNGKTFDWPLLQTRLVMRRADPAWRSPPHLDLLTLARRIFKPRLPDCALQTLEQAVLDLHRTEDLPGTLIPSRYFAWLRGGDQGVLEPVFLHNRQDVLSMVLLLARFESVLRGREELHPLDRFGRARFLESRGFRTEAIDEYRRLWQETKRGFRHHVVVRGAIGVRLARLLRREGMWKEARAVLEECWQTQAFPYPAAIELAKLLEHQARDLAAARRLVSDSLRLLSMAAVVNEVWRADLERRRDRLDRRLGLREDHELALTG